MNSQNFFSILIFIGIGYAIYQAYQNKGQDSDVKTVQQLPPSIQSAVSRMSEIEQNSFLLEYNKRKKSVFLSYILWIFFGLHYAYNKKIGLQFVFWFTLGGFFLWAIIDLFRMPSIVRDANAIIAREITNTVALGHAFGN